MAKLLVKVVRNEAGSYALTFPYDARMIREIKRRVPASARSYDPTARTWWFSRAADVADLRWACADWATFRNGRSRG